MAGIGGFIEQAMAQRAREEEKLRAVEQEAKRQTFWEKIRPEPEPERVTPAGSPLKHLAYANQEANIDKAPWAAEFGRQQQKEQERQSWNDNSYLPIDDQSARENRPPKPLTMPQVTPVSALKNRTALEKSYSPDAAQLLYDTPTMVNYGEEDARRVDPYAADTVELGRYYPPRMRSSRPGVKDIYINSSGEDPNTLNHEFAHKWYNERMPQGLRSEWEGIDFEKNPPEWTPSWILDQLRAYPGYYQANAVNPEMYAYAVQKDRYDLDDETRDRYYAGLYQGDSPQWQVAPIPQYMIPPTSDRLRERPPWSADENGRWG